MRRWSRWGGAVSPGFGDRRGRVSRLQLGLVFYHFETKDRLLAEAFEHAVEGDLARLDQAVTRGRDATDKVRRILRLYAPQGAAPGWTLQVDAWSEALRTPSCGRRPLARPALEGRARRGDRRRGGRGHVRLFRPRCCRVAAHRPARRHVRARHGLRLLTASGWPSGRARRLRPSWAWRPTTW